MKESVEFKNLVRDMLLNDWTEDELLDIFDDAVEETVSERAAKEERTKAIINKRAEVEGARKAAADANARYSALAKELWELEHEGQARKPITLTKKDLDELLRYI